MCSVDSCYDEVTRESKVENLFNAKCRKCCEKSATIVIRKKFPYCRDCFIFYFNHKYSSGLGKSKLLKNGDKVLVGFSGSPYSLCLIDLIFRSLSEDRKKKARFEVEIIYIDERCNVTYEERCQTFECVNRLLATYNYSVYYSPLSAIGDDVVLMKNCDFESTFHKCDLSLSDIKSETSRLDLILKLRNDQLFRAARKLNCNKIFTAETSDHIASNILSNVALGKGKQLPKITGMIEDRNDILMVRPVRECSKKEVIYYNVFNKLNYYNLVNNLEKDKFSSIQKLTEIFVSELQKSFPSTVLTVVSTGNKLHLDNVNSDSTCLICQSALDTSMDSTLISALDALRISNLVSNLDQHSIKSDKLPALNGSSGVSQLSKNESCGPGAYELHSTKLCYSCNRILKDCKSMEDNWLSSSKICELRRVVQETRMISEIKDFLL